MKGRVWINFSFLSYYLLVILVIKGCFWFIKKIILAMLLIYSFDLFAVSLNLAIPINLITVLLVSIFEIPALVFLVLFSFCV